MTQKIGSRFRSLTSHNPNQTLHSDGARRTPWINDREAAASGWIFHEIEEMKTTEFVWGYQDNIFCFVTEARESLLTGYSATEPQRSPLRPAEIGLLNCFSTDSTTLFLWCWPWESCVLFLWPSCTPRLPHLLQRLVPAELGRSSPFRSLCARGKRLPWETFSVLTFTAGALKFEFA